MNYTTETREETAQEIYYNGFYAKYFQEQYPTWQEFMLSDDFEDECARLRNKFD